MRVPLPEADCYTAGRTNASDIPENAMTEPAARSTPTERVRISCPGCGRNDYVSWPVGQPIYHWKCFNCSKSFDLSRDSGH